MCRTTMDECIDAFGFIRSWRCPLGNFCPNTYMHKGRWSSFILLVAS